VGFIQHTLLWHMAQTHDRTTRILAELGLRLFKESEDGVYHLLREHALREQPQLDLGNATTWDAFVRINSIESLSDGLVHQIVRYHVARLFDRVRRPLLSDAFGIWRCETAVCDDDDGDGGARRSWLLELD